MRKAGILALFAAVAAAGSIHVIVGAQSGVGQNINIVTGSANQYIGDMFRQRQNESMLGISGVNPAHMMAAYNDYRTVDFPNDPLVPGGPLASQAWIGLSFSDNGGKDWYTGLHPGHVSLPPATGTESWDQSSQLNAFDAASDPVIATTHNQFFVGGISFTPGGTSVGLVSRFTDRNDTETGQNIHFDGTRVLLNEPAPFFVDKPIIAAAPGAPNDKAYVYAAFVLFDESDPKKLSSTIRFFRSTDSGETWSSGITVSQPLSRNQAPWIVVDPNNPRVVYIGWRVFAIQTGGWANAIVGRKSTNGGASFTPSVPYPVALFLKAFDQPQGRLPTTLPIPRSNAYPTAVIDGNGAIHVALQEYVNPKTGVPLGPFASPSTGVPRITVTSSYNGGVFWTPRKAIDFGPGSGTQFMPVLTAVGEPGTSCPGRPGPRSRVILMYYDARASGIGTTPSPTGFVAGGDKQFDVRIAQASACNRDSLGRLVFDDLDPGPAVERSVQVSQYTRSAQPPHDIVTTPAAGLGYTAVNRPYPMFCGGNCAFTGDYLHLIPRVPYVQTPAGWKLTTATGVDKNTLPAPVVQGVWADTRDALLPTSSPSSLSPSFIDGLPWWDYSPPGTGLLSCVNPGSRDQNIYTAEYTPGGLFAAAPETFRTSNIPHAYPMYVENRTAHERFFKLTIDPAPAANASFDFASFVSTGPSFGVLHKSADIVIGPYSTVTGSVVVGAGQNTPVLVTVEQIDVNGAVMANGAKTTVTLYTAGEMAATPTETHTPVVAPVPVVTKPLDGQIPPEGIAANTFTQAPFSQTPFSQTPFSQTPFSQTPFSQTPFSQNATIYDVTDFSFQVTVTNASSHAAAFAALLTVRNSLELTGSYFFQVLINRLSSAPDLNGCQVVDRLQDIQISNIVTPFSQTPFSQTPFSQTPFSQTPFSQTPFSQTPFSQTPFSQTSDPRDPAISNSTFYIAPPGTSGPSYRAERPTDEVIYTLRAFQIKANADPAFHPLNPQTDVGVTVVADTPDVIIVDGQAVFDPGGKKTSSGGAAVPVKLAFLVQPTSTAPAQPMTPAVLVAIQDGFGNTLTDSTLPVTIALGNNPSAGTLSGTLTQNAVNGIATFSNLTVNNAGTGYTLFATSGNLAPATSQAFDITSLTITTLALSNGTQEVAYSQALFATGGVPPYTWSIDMIPLHPEFTLPTGLALATQTGVISGTPPGQPTIEVKTFRVRVTDADGHFATRDLCIHIDESTGGVLSATPASAANVVAALTGEGVTLSNVTYTGAPAALGTFTGGFGATSLSSGIVLSSGLVGNVNPPNDEDAKTTDNLQPEDTDLGALIEVTQNCMPENTETCDAAILEFDFVPNGNVVTFQYVFASEEYNEFVNSPYNDVFGFFLSGPAFPKANLALIPGTNPPTPVSINNVNGGNPFGQSANNATYYVNNDPDDGGADPLLKLTQADGLTKVLTLQANVTPGQTYHMKIAIADAGDHALDSWVLIKAASLTVVCPLIH